MKPISLLSIVLVSWLYAALAHAQTDDLDYYLPPGEVVWLQGDDDSRVLMLQQENREPQENGVILHVSELGVHPYQSNALSALYQSMPDYGWQSLALQSPTLRVNDIAWQQQSDARYPEPNDISHLHDALLERLELALQHAERYPGSLVLIAEGVSAALLVDLLTAQRVALPDALVVIGPYYPQWQLNQALATDLAKLQIPVLDLAMASSQSWVSQENGRRQQQARRHQHPNYRQRVLAPGQPAQQPRYLQHQVYGWLRHNALN